METHRKINKMLKKASSKAAGSEAPGAYREVREEAERLRTQLVAFFSILLAGGLIHVPIEFSLWFGFKGRARAA